MRGASGVNHGTQILRGGNGYRPPYQELEQQTRTRDFARIGVG